MKSSYKKIVAIIIGVKISTFVLIIFAHVLLPFNSNFYYGNFTYPKDEKVTLLTSFKTWDAAHYLYLADVGYKKNNISNAFYPLYPTLIKLLNVIINNYFISALLLSNIFSFFAVVFFFKLVNLIIDEKTAFVSSIFLLSFPTAFYFQLIYTESLFLFLCLLFFFLLYKRNYLASSIIAFFIPMTRVVGFMILIPQLLKIINDKNLKIKKFSVPTFNKPIIIHFSYYYFLPTISILGFVFYLLFMNFTTGDFLSGIKSGELFVGRYSIGNLLNPFDIYKNFFVQNPSLHNYNQSIIDRILFLFYLLILIPIYKYLPRPLFAYSLIGLTPFLGSFMGYSRYLFSVFPMFIVLGILYQKKWGLLILPLIILFLSLQVAFIVLYSLNFWVS